MNPALQSLIELDKINQEIRRLTEEVASLPKRVAAIETKLAGAKTQVESAQIAIKNYETGKRKHESEIQDWQQKITKYKEQQSSVKTNEQYKALIHEIEFAERAIGDIEEKILIGMESLDGLQAGLKAAQEELKADQLEIEQEKDHAHTVTAEDERKLAELNRRRNELRAGADQGLLATFERVSAKRTNAIAEVIDQKCTACNVMMRPQRYQELITGNEVLVCDSCGRLLYVDPEHQAATAPKKPSGPERSWYYQPGATADDPGKFLFFTNLKASCSLHSFDAGSGQTVQYDSRKKTTFQEAFADALASAKHLHAQFVPDESDEYLDPEALEELQLQAHIAPGALR
jgi:predicted  nucleic acid-binding Zn-ribbon protein